MTNSGDDNMKITVGVDPGVTGGISVDFDGDVEVYKMSTTHIEIKEFFQKFKSIKENQIHVYIEKVSPNNIWGKKTHWVLSANAHSLKQCIMDFGIPFTEVAPNTWMRYLKIKPKMKNETDSIWKGRLYEQAKQLYPKTKFNKKMADSVLIMHYGKKVWRE